MIDILSTNSPHPRQGRSIMFTQYLLPYGRRQTICIDRPERIAAKADTIRKAGYRFEVEILTTGEVSLTIVGKPLDEDIDEELDVAIRIVENGPCIVSAIDEMVSAFGKELQEE